MPIGLGLGSSHPQWVLLKTPEEWEEAYARVVRDKPQPPAAALETPEVIQGYIKRIAHSFAILASQLADYDPELLIIIGSDQGELFDESNVPSLMMFLGDDVWGHNVPRFQPPSEANLVRMKVDVHTSKWLLDRLVLQEGFDVAFSTELHSLGGRKGGISHAFVRPASFIMPRPDLPTVIICENAWHPPCLSAQRCYDLGRALSRLLKDDPRRIAILGSGGLSHDPEGPRSGWIDEPLDKWFLDQLTLGRGKATTAMYAFDSMTMRGGTGEMRAWITVGGAMDEIGAKAVVIDYIPAHHAVTGLGFAYWPTCSGSAISAAAPRSASTSL